MLYRVLESLRYLKSSERIPAGAIRSLKRVSPATIEMLLKKKRIVEVHAPPLAIIPGFEERAEVYAEQGIQDVNDLVEAEEVPEEDIEEAMRWVTPGYDGPDVYEVEDNESKAIVE